MKSFLSKYFNKLINSSSLREDLNRNMRTNNEILWGQIFNNTITDSSWLKIKSFSPGRWAMGYPALYITYRILNDAKPKNILEFGLGESSKLTYQYIQNNPGSSLKIIEQDENWLDYFSIEKFDVKSYTLVLPIIETSYFGAKINIYDNLLPSIKDTKYNFVIIDGPWGSSQYSRHQIVDIIKENLLDDDFVILMDDHERLGERQTTDEVLALLKTYNKEYHIGNYSGTKDTLVICSDKYKFLTSL